MRLRLMFTVMAALSGADAAARINSHAYRDFWYPTYHGERLDYCTSDEKVCGLLLANDYCQVMGYTRARKQRVDHHVGLTHYLGSKEQCKGWRCDGFMLISCEKKFAKNHPDVYVYRSKIFAFPRVDHYRVDWCYSASHGCGERSAYAFCRKMGYSKSIAHKQDVHVFATKTLGDRALCFGKACHAFKAITCYR